MHVHNHHAYTVYMVCFQVLDTLKGYGIEQVEHVLLPDDPNNEGKIKGFALLEFNSHSDAMEAFQRLQKPDAVFGCDRSAKVAFAHTPMHPAEEVLLQVNNLFCLQACRLIALIVRPCFS